MKVDVALEPDQAACPRQRCFVERLGAVGVLHEPRGLGGLVSGHDFLGAVLLQRQRSVVADRALGGVGPHCPPGAGMLSGVPGRFSLERRVVLDDLAVLRGDGVDQLGVGERVAVPAEVGG
jgi:hypothetical protein